MPDTSHRTSDIRASLLNRSRLATLSQLPSITGLSPEAVLPVIHHMDALRVNLVRKDAGKWPDARLFDIDKTQAFLEANPDIGLPPTETESMFGDTELKRRRRIFTDACFIRHGIVFRMPLKQQARELFAEFGVACPTWDETEASLFSCFVTMPNDMILHAFLAARDFDEGLLDNAVEEACLVASGYGREVADAVAAAAADWQADFRLATGQLDDEQRKFIRTAMPRLLGRATVAGVSGRKVDRIGVAVQHELSTALANATRNMRQLEATTMFSQRLGYDRYPALFPLARQISRRIVFMAGPTNSGKTYGAMQLATNAASAVILSPLRLLALEHRDLLAAAGCAAGLVTGEERDVPEGTTHVARTIETMDFNQRTDVAVIDEIQMLGDASRGWAWTQALVGVPADVVVLTGSEDAIPLVERIVSTLGEPLEIRHFKRKTPLVAVSTQIGPGDLRKGDALIAFSRRSVHEYREYVREAGLSVATVYGALGPEVRRSEAARFREGLADVMVATDAIGMGLNLPIERIVFTATEKFDGERRRQLSVTEILQIAGRAGRFGQFTQGEVAVLRSPYHRQDLDRVRSALTSRPQKLDGKAFVRPNVTAVRTAAEMLGTQSLTAILRHLQSALVRNHPDLRMADIEEDIEKAKRLDTTGLSLADRYAYAITPLNMRSTTGLDRLVEWAHAHHRRNVVAPYLIRPSSDLESIEHQTHLATVWLWLSQRFPEVYPGAPAVSESLKAANAVIERQLEKSSGQKTREPTGRGKHRVRYREAEDDEPVDAFRR